MKHLNDKKEDEKIQCSLRDASEDACLIPIHVDHIRCERESVHSSQFIAHKQLQLSL